MKLHYKFCFLIIGLLSISCGSFRPSYIEYKDGVYNDDIDSKEYTDYEQRRQSYQSGRQEPRKIITPTDYKSYFLLKSLEYRSKSLGKLDVPSTNSQRQFLDPPPNQDERLQSRYQQRNPNSYDHFYASYYGLGWNVPMGYFANYGMNPYASMGYGYNPYWGMSWGGWPSGYNSYWGGYGGYYNPYWGWGGYGGYYGGYGGYYGSYYGNNYYNNNNSVRRNVDRRYSRTDSRRNYSENYNVGRRSSYDSNTTPSRPMPSRSNNSYYTPSSNSYQRSSAPSYRSFGGGGGARRSSGGYNSGRR